ncbi:biotin-(acetyl-CoA carboxylase) ligase [Hyphomicrobium nitrativorans NL23]|uniref:biotin--[biotin carboxyl-carrier protein] ligase n=1 Tax=Hyphomicrobium nitrativorans NL23 TaxID=1029756 RepID=V5SHM7_9HYPH|nr:biotin--[acetyl-CoA-carboxylase] ligase [Hyphomicrobium nitrativorans]AHB49560.1 biotin-(acetyl-CoA carboxylase) ligase [Hyphomicrobium nitrativorans NL23]
MDLFRQNGRRLLRLPSVDSTNAEALRRAAAGERGPLWILADVQTAGRGRAGRSWVSAPGNLHASLLVTLAAPAPKAYQLSLVTGVAVYDAIRIAMQPAPAGLCLKWPNDILIGTEKAGGILIESTTSSAGLSAVIGIGIDIASVPPDLGRPVTHLAAHGICPRPEGLLACIAAATEDWLAVWKEGHGFAAIRNAWLNRAHPIGERMSIDTGAERIGGAFHGLDDDGALILDTDTGARRFTFGDVSLAR